jgi:hypothetical protein
MSYKIWCLVEGDKNPFSIIVPSTIFIGELQKAIKKERSNVFQRVDASDVTLWKVRYL